MFEETHEKVEGLRRVFAGEASSVETERAVAHLTGCRECWLLATRAIAAQKERDGLAAQGPLRPLIDLYEMEQARLEEWLEAQALWIEIRSLTPKARRDKVRLTSTLHTVSFLDVLLEAGMSAPLAESEELFYLALLVAQQLSPPRVSVELRNDLCAECCAEIANARRRLGKWPAARDALKKGSEYVERGSKNGVAEGKVLCVTGALEDDLGNTEEAVSTLQQAVKLFESSSQTFLLSRTLTQLAYILVGENPAEGLRIVEQALSLIPSNNPRLVWFAETAKIDCLMGIGASREALVRFNAMKGLHEQFREPFMHLRRRFNAAKLLEHLGRIRKAEALFQEVIADELEHGLVKDFFLDLVYLFGFHLRRGQTSEAIAVCRRASQELSLLDDEEGSSETAREQMRMVWKKLEEEVRKGNVELGATEVLRKYVRSHWRFPADDPPFLQEQPGA
jgi:tetratricopeptide (TPR) repeat protein